jgi:hypothetical protein
MDRIEGIVGPAARRRVGGRPLDGYQARNGSARLPHLLRYPGGAHAIAAEVRVGETRLFDPNAGEWLSEPPGNAWEALGTLLQFLLKSVYELRAVRHLSVIHFPPKARHS